MCKVNNMPKEDALLTGCGEFCGSCPYYLGEKPIRCLGCSAQRGRPFWGECKIYSCIDSHEVSHCGLCTAFPCDQFVNHYDPNNPEGQRNAAVRAGVLAYRAKHGDEKTLALIQKLGKPRRA